MAQCPNCGAIASAKFCPNCGTQIPQTPPVAAAAVPPQPTPPPAYPTPGQPAYPNAYPNAYQQMPPQKSGGNPFKLIGIIIGALLAVVLGLFIVLGSGPVGTPVITDQVDAETMEPLRELTTVAPATDSIYAAVEVDVDKGQTLTAKWYYEGQLQEQVNTDLTLDEEFAGWVSFKINNGGTPWPTGQFKVEIYLEGKLEQTTEFQVK